MAVSSSLQLLWDLCGEFKEDDPAWLERLLSEAASELDSQVFGQMYQKAAVYLAAHLAAMSKRSELGMAGAGAVAGQTGKRVSFFAGVSGDDDLNSTPWGRSFMRIARRVGAALPNTTGLTADGDWPTVIGGS